MLPNFRFAHFGFGCPEAVRNTYLVCPCLPARKRRRRRCPESGLLQHSDQGRTYASEDYRSRLEQHGIACSMSRRGNCYDNAVMESFFSSIKSEVAGRFKSCGAAKMELFDYIEVFYNQRPDTPRSARSAPPRSSDARSKRVWILCKTAQNAVSHRPHTRPLIH